MAVIAAHPHDDPPEGERASGPNGWLSRPNRPDSPRARAGRPVPSAPRHAPRSSGTVTFEIHRVAGDRMDRDSSRLESAASSVVVGPREVAQARRETGPRALRCLPWRDRTGRSSRDEPPPIRFVVSATGRTDRRAVARRPRSRRRRAQGTDGERRCGRDDASSGTRGGHAGLSTSFVACRRRRPRRDREPLSQSAGGAHPIPGHDGDPADAARAVNASSQARSAAHQAVSFDAVHPPLPRRPRRRCRPPVGRGRSAQSTAAGRRSSGRPRSEGPG
jgi:hypothetical protein